MRLYMVELCELSEGHAGFEWFARRDEAAKRAREWNRRPGLLSEDRAEVKVVEFAPTRKGVLGLLRIHASHPDNG